MNPNTTQTEEKVFQEALDTMPEEVRDYMWSPAFDYAIDVAEKVIELTSQEKECVRDIAYDLLMRLIDMETAARKLLEQKIIPEKTTKIMYYLDQEVLQSARNLVNYYGDINEIARTESNQDEAIENSQQEVFSKLSHSFTTPSTIPPVKRTYTDLPATPTTPKPLSEAIPASTPTKPTIDPYRIDPTQE